MASKKKETNGRVHDVNHDALPLFGLGDDPVPMTKAEIASAAKFSQAEARALVGMYMSFQKVRKSSRSRESALESGRAAGDPFLVTAFKEELERNEKNCKRALLAYALHSDLGRWCMSHKGIAEVIAAGLMAHIDLTRAETAGAIWRFAGLMPPEEIVWEEGEKRPWNAALKSLLWNMAECFKRASAYPGCFYGEMYKARKLVEQQWNATGKLAKVARARLERAKEKGWRISPEQRRLWSAGRVQDRGLDLRAMRYVEKIFLSHYHEVGRTLLGLPIRKPFALEHCPGHTDYIPPPNWDAVNKKVILPGA